MCFPVNFAKFLSAAFLQNIFERLLLKIVHSEQIFIQNQQPQSIIHVRSQPAFTCSKLTIETLEQGVKYVQS